MKKAIEFFEEIKPKFTKQQQDLINLLFEIEDKSPKTIEEFQKLYNLTYEQVRNLLRDLLDTHKEEIKEMRPIVKKCVSDNIIIKENDILELDMRVNYPYEDDDTTCSIWLEYTLNGKEFSSFDFNLPEDELYSDISDYINSNLETDTGITDYEIFDVQDSDCEHQTAKIKAKRIEIVIRNVHYIL